MYIGKQSTLAHVLCTVSLPMVNIVWLKRDLRLTDHAPLYYAMQSDLPIVMLYILDDNVVNDKHYTPRHWQFVRDCLVDIGKVLNSYNQQLTVLQGQSIEIFEELKSAEINYIFKLLEKEKAAEVLIENGAKEVHSYITHGVLSGPAVERVTKSVMKSLVITDTIEATAPVTNAPNIRIVPTAPMFAQATLNIWNGTSVSSLFDMDTLGPIYEGLYTV